MPPTVRTQAQLDSLFVDNDLGEISAGDGRDLIATVFGFVSVSDPTNENDSVDSAGVGAFFDEGSRWTNTVSQRVWECFSGTPHFAVWHAVVYVGDAVGGRLAGYLPNPTLAASGVIPGDYGDSSNYPAFRVELDGTLSIAGTFPVPPSSVPVPLILTPPADNVEDLILRQFSSSQSGNLLEVQDSTSITFAARITPQGDFSNPGPLAATGLRNERFGDGALRSLTTGNDNNVFGALSGQNITTGTGNTAQGRGTLYALTTGGRNTVVGCNAGRAVTGRDNTAIGFRACTVTGAANLNTGVGSYALVSNVAGEGNTGVGYCALYRTLADGSTAAGQKSLYNATTGQNVAVGSRAGFTISTGTRNTIVGSLADVLAGSDTDSVVIGHAAAGHGSHTITIGTTADDAYLGSAQLPHSNAINLVLASPGSGADGPLIPRALVAGDIPALPASAITSGTFSVGLIPGLPGSIITSGSIPLSAVPSLPASIITSGTFSKSIISLLGTWAVADIPGLPGSIITSGVIGIGFLPTAVSTDSEQAGITATGSVQGTAFALAANNNQVTTTAINQDGVILPDRAGARIFVANASSNNLKVYPPVGANFSGSVVNQPDSILAPAKKMYTRVSATLWYVTTF